MPSFDIVSEVNKVEIRNAVDQCNKEVTNSFDFKGSDARVEIQEQGEETVLMVFADDNFKLAQVKDVLIGKLTKRGVDARALDPCLLYTSPSPRDGLLSRMPSSA